ncbi:MAG: diguanylate cyclase, partial [Anaerolineales bacterium]|nr:diguanylate cyclase [Anaerolineales bacterium]MDW8445772.1 diguanylate cyclase [Anaerolineales bacterium]
KAAQTIERIHKLVELNNKYYSQAPALSLSIGMASAVSDVPLEKLITQADNAMYKDKGRHYRRRSQDQELL